MEAMDIQAVESKLSDVTVTAIPMSGKNIHKDLNHGGNSHTTISTVPASSPSSIGKDKDNGVSKYAQLLAVIEEMGKEILKMMSWQTKCEWHTGYSADSVEWCPVEPHQNVLVCGTYQLENSSGEAQDKKQTRLGKIYLFVIEEDTIKLNPIQTIETPGILDQKWCYHPLNDHPLLAVVTSIGTLQLYQLSAENGTYSLKLWKEHVIGQDILALSLDWSTNKTAANEPRLLVSDSEGSVTLLKIAGEEIVQEGKWKSHNFEAWISAFNYWNPDMFYSGGDDCLFKSYDARVRDGVVATNRSHEAGVTAIRNHLEVEHHLLTGSYDEKIRRWDTRNLKSFLTESPVGGGLWRIKHHPKHKDLVLTACMYGGFKLLRQDAVLAEYTAHDSIAYGTDWSHGHGLIATCSFYDCKMHISEVLHL